MSVKELELLAEKNRKRLVEVVYAAKAGHIGGDLSCLNVMTALYFEVMKGLTSNPSPRGEGNIMAADRDRFVLSKGHCVEALYVTLEAKGFLAPEVLDTLGKFGSILSGHPTIEVPGIEVNSGALGHGLSIGVGMAIAEKMNRNAYLANTPTNPTPTYRTFVLMGDGEQGEGSIYEAAMAGNKYQLDNLVAIIDRNHLQISGDTEDVMPIDSIKERWSAFGWDVIEMNGDSMEDIVKAFKAIDYQNKKPHLLISHTTKGKGVSFMEGIAKWHHGVLNEQQCKDAVAEISDRIEKLSLNTKL